MKEEKLDSVLILLLFGMMFFTGMLFAAEIWFKDDSQLFQVIAALLTGFSGSFFTRLKPKEVPPSIPFQPDRVAVDARATLHQDALPQPPTPPEEKKEKLND